MDTASLERLPAGSTIILSTTSPDKRAEYEKIFKRFDLNFVFLDDLGLSPQKTDEMTNSYDGNLLQKADELSRALYTNMNEIKDRLGNAGFDTDKPIIGMVEDSGIEFYPINKDEEFRDAFRAEFKTRLDARLYDQFLEDDERKERTFPGMSNDEILEYLAGVELNNVWMTEIGENKVLPGPNYKPIYETLPGGVREMFDIMHDAIEAVSKKADDYDGRPLTGRTLLRFRNHCSMMLVQPYERPQDHLDALDIVEGESKGDVLTRDQIDSLLEYRINSPKVKHRLGRLFTNDFLIPDGQVNHTDYTQRRLMEKHNLLDSREGEVASYYRLAAIEDLSVKYEFPKARKVKGKGYKYKKRADNADAPNVMVLHGAGGQKTNLVKAFEKKLEEENFTILDMPNRDELLSDPNARLMGRADVAFLMPDENGSEMDNARLLLGAVVDKQVMPSAKEKTIVVLNPRGKDGKGNFDASLKMLRHNKYGGLKNGISEINHVVEYDPEDYKGAEGAARLFGEVKELLAKEADRKRHRLTGIEPVKPEKDIAPEEIPSLPTDQFTIFVAGGAANEYPEYKAPANQLGRFIHDEGWTLVTGAGQKEGPMGAVHSGFVEAYLSKTLVPKAEGGELKNKSYKKIQGIVEKLVDQDFEKRRLHGELAAQRRNKIMEAVFEQPNAEFLVHEAPKVLEKLLQPKPKSKVYEALGSLKETGRMIGYSMPPLLISEGSGKWPLGMKGYNSGNMQRRMHEMMQASAHVYMTGGQGTYQELVDSVKLAVEMNIQRKEAGLEPKPICVLDQRAYKGGIYKEDGTVFRPALEAIDADLEKLGLEREDVGLQTFQNMRKLEAHLKDYAKTHWDAGKEARLRA